MEEQKEQNKKSGRRDEAREGILACLRMLREGPLQGKLRRNLLTGRAEIDRGWEQPESEPDWHHLEDADVSGIRCYMCARGIDYRSDLDDALKIQLSSQPYDPVTQLLDGLVWDGKRRAEDFLCHCMDAEDTPYTRMVSLLIFHGAVKRAYEPGCKFDYMPVFVGCQGGGKSTMVRLLNLRDEWYREVTTISGREGIEAITGGWVCEFSEMMAMTRPRDIEAVKAWVSRQVDVVRRPYERNVSDHPRRIIMIGTTNNSRFLMDKSGNRRFLPVQVGDCGSRIWHYMDSLKSYILQCYAEAVYDYKLGEGVTEIPAGMAAEVREEQEAAVEDDWRVGMIHEYLAEKQPGEYTCVIEVFQKAVAKSDIEKPRRSDSVDIARIIEGTPGWRKTGIRRFGHYGKQQAYILADPGPR